MNFFTRQLEDEIARETFDITLYGLMQHACLHTVNPCRIAIGHHPLTPCLVYLALYHLGLVRRATIATFPCPGQ